jgi:hypothetical protein
LSRPHPYVAPGDAHSLAEIAVESSDGQQIVEIGTTVDPAAHGDNQTRLFAFHWVNGQATCYDACGFVQTSSTVHPGMPIQVTNATTPFQIKESSGTHNWWLYYGGTAIGYFPPGLWGGTFTRSGLTQFFGEVAAAGPFPCTDMGNGTYGTQAGAARIDNSIIILPGDNLLTATLTNYETNTNFYNRQQGRSFGYGGLGAC